MILARTGALPAVAFQTSIGIRRLGLENPALASLRSRYGVIAHNLHADCFRDGHCEPEEYMAELIGSVAFYIQDAYGQAAS